MKHYLNIYAWEFDGFEDWREKYSVKVNPDVFLSYGLVETFFEGIGVLFQRGLLDISMIDDFMSSDLEAYWLKMKPVTEGLRDAMSPTWSEYT